ncbi:SoxR reducing system RseC family protein [Bacillus mojavensis]
MLRPSELLIFFLLPMLFIIAGNLLSYYFGNSHIKTAFIMLSGFICGYLVKKWTTEKEVTQ